MSLERLIKCSTHTLSCQWNLSCHTARGRGAGVSVSSLKGHSQCFRLCGLHSPAVTLRLLYWDLLWRQPAAGLGTASCRAADQSSCRLQQPVAPNTPRLPQGQIRGGHPPLSPILTLCEYPSGNANRTDVKVCIPRVDVEAAYSRGLGSELDVILL